MAISLPRLWLSRIQGAPEFLPSPNTDEEAQLKALPEHLGRDRLVQLLRALGRHLPRALAGLGGPLFAAKAFAIERLRWINPREASEEDLLAILHAAW